MAISKKVNTDALANKLKPCPFCGEGTVLVEKNINLLSDVAKVMVDIFCPDCEVYFTIEANSEEEVTKRWNRRVRDYRASLKYRVRLGAVLVLLQQVLIDGRWDMTTVGNHARAIKELLNNE